MSSQCSMVWFDVQLKVIVETVLEEERHDSLRVVVVLVTGRLFWLGLDQQLTREADLLFIS